MENLSTQLGSLDGMKIGAFNGTYIRSLEDLTYGNKDDKFDGLLLGA